MTQQTSRRAFLRELALGMVVAPALATGAAATQSRAGGHDGEPFWEEIRRQFAFEDAHVPMNAANLCPSPRVVAERVSALTRDIDVDCSSQNRRKFGELLEQSRAAVAGQLGVTADEIALVRNTSEANNVINNGLPLDPGAEIVVWDQNHPTNNVAWDVRAARFGLTVTRIATPAAPSGIDELVGTFERALTPRTRVLALTHVSNVSGVRLPVRALAEVAHRRGIHVHVDGAQSWGALDVNLRDLGCDSYTASAHKWLVGPKEVGLLFVTTERIDDIWPSVVAPSWGGQVEPRPTGARKFESMGQRDDAALAAIGTTVAFQNRMGLAEIEARVLELAARLKAGLREAGYDLVTPVARELSGGVCIASVDGDRRQQIVGALYTEHGIAGAATGGLRLCPHIYNTHEHVDRAITGAGALRRPRVSRISRTAASTSSCHRRAGSAPRRSLSPCKSFGFVRFNVNNVQKAMKGYPGPHAGQGRSPAAHRRRVMTIKERHYGRLGVLSSTGPFQMDPSGRGDTSLRGAIASLLRRQVRHVILDIRLVHRRQPPPNGASGGGRRGNQSQCHVVFPCRITPTLW